MGRRWDENLPVDLRCIVWDFAGSLLNKSTRLHKFCTLELNLWRLIISGRYTPSSLRRHFTYVGRDAIRRLIYTQYHRVYDPIAGLN